jgi:molybdopterin-guanine dinucleotide biosynthesis protein A
MTVAAAILAGGRARRLGGVDKGRLEVGGARIVDRQAAVLLPLVDELLLVVGDPAGWALDRARVVVDAVPGQGPLGGIAAALAASRAEALLVFGCDLPFLDEKLVRLVRDEAPGAAAVVPRVGGRPQPLHARYARTVAPVVAVRLARGARRLVELLDDLDVAYLDEARLRALDPTLRGLTNINTPEALAAARASVAGR